MKVKTSKNFFLSIVLSFLVVFGTVMVTPTSVHAEETVLVTRSGSKYHKRKCGNGTYYTTTLSSAKAKGLTPCEKCFGGSDSQESISGGENTATIPSAPQITTPVTDPAEPSPSRNIRGCIGVPVKISVSEAIGNNVTFRCDQGCTLKTEKAQGMIGGQDFVGAGTSGTNLYILTFAQAGKHKVSICNYQGQVVEVVLFDISQTHMYGEGVVTKATLCETNGEKRFICSICQNVCVEVLKASGHQFDQGTEGQKATCTEDGVKIFKCLKCNETRTERIPQTGHSFSGWSVSEKPTALKKGEQTRVCLNCGEGESRDIQKLAPSVRLEKKKVNLKIGKKFILKIADKTYGDFVKKWKCSNEKVVCIEQAVSRAKNRDKCILWPLSRGKATITLTMESGCKVSCIVYVR